MNQKRLKELIKILNNTPKVISSLLFDLPQLLVNSNEGNKTWSAFDIIGHLIHGEKTDWIPRTINILEFGEAKPFEPFDRFAQERESIGKNIDELLNEFEKLRKENLHILNDLNLADEDFNKTGIHPEFGTVSLGELLNTWVVHDLNHIAQISRVMSHQLKPEIGPWKKYLRIANI